MLRFSGNRYSSVKIIIVAIVLISVFLRFYGIDSESYWLDEAAGIRQAQVPYQKTIQLLSNEVNLPLYITLLNLWVHLFGVSEIASRSLSAIFGIASVFLMFLLGRKLFSQRVGLYSSIIMCFSYMSVYYSQETRLYSLFIFLSIASFYSYVSFLQKRNAKNALLYLIATIPFIYTHAFAFLGVLVQNIYFIWKNIRKRKNLIGWVWIQLIILLSFTPWISILFKQLQNLQNFSWIPFPTFLMVLNTFTVFFNNAAVLLIFIYLAFLFIRKKIKNLDQRDVENLKILLLWAILPVLIIIFFSITFIPIYNTRYILLSLPAFYVVFSWMISKAFEKEMHEVILVSLVVLLCGITLVFHYAINEKDNWRDVTGFVKENVGEGETLYVHPYFQQYPFSYYYDMECFAAEHTQSCNFEKHNVISLADFTCCNDSTIVTSTDSRNQLKDHINGTVWLLEIIHKGEISREMEEDNRNLFRYLDSRKDLVYEEVLWKGITIYRFE